MSEPSPSATSRPGYTAPGGRALIADALGLILAIVGWIYTFAKVASGMERPSDFSAYYLAGRAYQLGLDYYQRDTIESLGAAAGLRGDFGPYLYPPLFAAAVSPLAALDYASARWLWAAVCLFCLLVALALTQRAAGVALPPGWRGPVLGLVAFFPPVADDALKGQVTCVLLLLLAGAWLAQQRGQSWLSGALVAVAVAVKLAPALLLVHFALRRDYRALAAGALAALALVGASLVIAGPNQNVTYVTQQIPYIGLQVGASQNVSLPGALTRLWAVQGSHLGGQSALNIALCAGWLVMGALLLGAAWGERRRPSAAGLGYGFTVAVMLLATPSSQTYTLVLALLPIAAVAARWRGSRRFNRAVVDLALVATMLLSVPPNLPLSAGPMGATASVVLILLVSSLPTLGLLLLCAVAGALLVRGDAVTVA